MSPIQIIIAVAVFVVLIGLFVWWSRRGLILPEPPYMPTQPGAGPPDTILVESTDINDVLEADGTVKRVDWKQEGEEQL